MPPDAILTAHLVLSSRFANIEVAERALIDLADQAGFSGDDSYWLVTAMREAAANAIRHGNRQDPDLDVLIDYRFSSDEVAIRIEDQGDVPSVMGARAPLEISVDGAEPQSFVVTLNCERFGLSTRSPPLGSETPSYKEDTVGRD